MTVKWLARLVALVGACGVGLGWVVSSALAGDNATAGSPVTLDLQFRPVVGFVADTCNDEPVSTSGDYALVALQGFTLGCPRRFLLIDDRTGKRAVVHLKGGSLTAVLSFGAPWILFEPHSGEFRLYNIKTGSERAAACRRCGPDGPYAYAVGARWVEFFVQKNDGCNDSGLCSPAVRSFYNIQTGQSRFQASQSSTSVPVLDSRKLFHRLCRPLRVPARTAPPRDSYHPLPSLTLYGTFAVASDGGEFPFSLERCGSNLQMPVDLPNQDDWLGSLTANDHAVLWQVSDGHYEWDGQFAGLLLPSLRPFTGQLPASLPTPWFIVLDSHELYVIDATGRVWRAAFPPR